MFSLTQLIKKEVLLELRQKYALNGIILQVISSVFVVYLSVKFMNNNTWNGIYWVIMLFISINASAKSFIGEGKSRNLYYHFLVQPQVLLLSKFLYNAGLNVVLSGLCLLTFFLLLGFPVESPFYYCFITFLGSIGFSATFTMLSAISSKAGNSNLLMPVLSLPLIIPLLLILIKACKRAMDGLDTSILQKDLLILIVFNLLIVTIAYLLFPSVWKE
jgi:heme exporter protein B